jgi:hypothetical protein
MLILEVDSRLIGRIGKVLSEDGTCHHSMARPQVADGRDGLQIWRVAANVLNKQSLTVEKGWSFSLEVGRGADNFSP